MTSVRSLALSSAICVFNKIFSAFPFIPNAIPFSVIANTFSNIIRLLSIANFLSASMSSKATAPKALFTLVAKIVLVFEFVALGICIVKNLLVVIN
jgi:hypothetical protein